MIIPPKSSLSHSIPVGYRSSLRAGAPSTQSASAAQYDQVSISRATGAEDSFRREWVSRLVQEVRTAHTSGDIARIKQEVKSGSYQPDATEIATKLLLEEQQRAN